MTKSGNKMINVFNFNFAATLTKHKHTIPTNWIQWDEEGEMKSGRTLWLLKYLAVVVFGVSLMYVAVGNALRISGKHTFQRFAYVPSSILAPDETTDCNYLNCDKIPFPIVRPIPSNATKNLRNLIEYRNRLELVRYSALNRTCLSKKEKWSRPRPTKRDPEKAVKLHWMDPVPFLDFGRTTGLDECSVPCEMTNFLIGADVVIRSVHYSRMGNVVDFWIKTKQMMSPHQQLAYMSVENILSSPYIDEQQQLYDALLKHVDISVLLFPFSDVPVIDSPNVLGQVNLNEEEDFDSNKFDRILSKKKSNVLVVDFITNCRILPHQNSFYRTTYIRELETLGLNIDHFGKCPRFVSPPKMEPYLSTVHNRKLRKKLITPQYKFVLAFENSLSNNYLTEKLPDALEAVYSVPIYLGVVNLADLVHCVPRGINLSPQTKTKTNSAQVPCSKIFLEANHMDPAELVDYLKYLDRNESAYREFFEWRKSGMTWDDIMNKDLYYKNIINSELEFEGKSVSMYCRMCEVFANGGRKTCHEKKYKKRKMIVGMN